MNDSCHVPVLMQEVLQGLKLDPGDKADGSRRYFLDCTFGGGGHSRAILASGDNNYLVACDRNSMTLEFAKKLESDYPGRFQFLHSSFSDLKLRINDVHINDVHTNDVHTNNDANTPIKFDGILADLGLSSDQLAAQLGFSFSDTTALDMRMDLSQELTAAKVVNEYSEQQLVKVFKSGGAENAARIVAQKIVAERPFTAAKSLADLISRSVPDRFHKPGRHPATVFFQAIRIEVNQELKEIGSLLDFIPNLIKSNGRLAIISFHSLEDKVVTHRLRQWEQGDSLPALHPQSRMANAGIGRLLSKKAITATPQECSDNPRSRSALLRIFEFN